MQTIQFILALAIGWFLVDHDQPWLWIGLWAVAASAALTLLTLVVQHVRLPPASRSPRGGRPPRPPVYKPQTTARFQNS